MNITRVKIVMRFLKQLVRYLHSIFYYLYISLFSYLFGYVYLVPEAKSIANLQAQIDIVQHGKSGVYELTHTLPNKTIQTVFKLGVPFLDEVPTGNVFQVIALNTYFLYSAIWL